MNEASFFVGARRDFRTAQAIRKGSREERMHEFGDVIAGPFFSESAGVIRRSA